MTSRSSLCGLILVALLIIAPTATAQFTIVSSSPTNGALIQPGTLSICLTFSAELDTTQAWPFNGEEGLVAPVAVTIAEPQEAIDYNGWTYDPVAQRLCFTVGLEDETDYVFLVSLARDLQGHDLAAPFELHVSTAGSWGARSVSGTLTRADGGSTVGAAIALFDMFPFGSDNARLIAGSAVPAEGGAYTIPYVREGWYFPISAQDLNQDGFLDPSLGDLFGYYDPDADGRPDSVLVAATNLTGIDMTLDLMGQLRARDGLDPAHQAAVAIAPDADLQAVASAGENVDAEGRCFGWLYHFYSMQQDNFIDVFYTGMMTEIDIGDSSNWPQMATLDLAFMDSNAALDIALAAGGAEFEESMVDHYRNMVVGNLHWIWPPEPEAVLWAVFFSGHDTLGQWQDFLVVLDALTGEVYHVDGSALPDQPLRPRELALGLPWPNPFNPVVHIPYELGRAQDVRLAVYNLAGQQVAELAQGPQAAGHHEAQLEGGSLPSGLYFVVLEAEGRSEVRKVARLK